MMTGSLPHQYVDRLTGQVETEQLIGDRSVALLYNLVREQAPAMFRLLTSDRMSSLLGYWHFDRPPILQCSGRDIMLKLGIDPAECVEPLGFYDTYRKVFERQIRYWSCRPMADSEESIVSPADSRVIVGSFKQTSSVFIKEKFFSLAELVGETSEYCRRFSDGDFAIFRLTPDKYHYNHFPVSGRIIDFYQIDGTYHSCNPSATIALASILSKNRRVVTVIDTDVEGGSTIGCVAMIEIVALMIGDIEQCYSRNRYEDPVSPTAGMFCRRGAPKSLFRPGSSTVLLLFENDRINFSSDLLQNRLRGDVTSRFSTRFNRPVVETEVQVRSEVATRAYSCTDWRTICRN
jgi:phosphatidylserine decarboxylase